MKDQIRPLYARLQGYLSQAPTLKSSFDPMLAEPLCLSVNHTLDQLTKITRLEYHTHKFEDKDIEHDRNSPQIYISTFRGKLGAIIAELHGTYFYDEPAPFSGMPHTIISQNSSQQQNTQISILLDIQSKIDESLANVRDEKEKNFLSEIKSKLSYVRNIIDLIALITATAQHYGISLDRLKEIFHS